MERSSLHHAAEDAKGERCEAGGRVLIPLSTEEKMKWQIV